MFNLFTIKVLDKQGNVLSTDKVPNYITAHYDLMAELDGWNSEAYEGIIEFNVNFVLGDN